LACLGKIIGGGLPIGDVVGDAEIMGLLDPRRENGSRVFHSWTFNGNPLSLAVGRATIEELSRSGRFGRLSRRTSDLKDGLSEELRRRQVPRQIIGEGAMFNIYLTGSPVTNFREAKKSDARTRRLLDLELISRGVYLKPENRFCLSLAHSEDDVNLTRERFAGSLDSA
jgi:glutamate-1-semialdehyde 2,1-aminomutase